MGLRDWVNGRLRWGQRDCIQPCRHVFEHLEPRILLSGSSILSSQNSDTYPYENEAVVESPLSPANPVNNPNTAQLNGIAILAEGSVVLGKDVVVNDGLTVSHHSTSISRNVETEGIRCGSTLQLSSNTVVEGNIIANHHTSISTDCSIIGDIDGGLVLLETDSYVAGSVTAKSNIIQSNGVDVVGEILPFDDPQTYTPVDLPDSYAFQHNNGDHISTRIGETTVLAPGEYASLTLSRQNELYLSSGEYNFSGSIFASKDLDLNLDLSAGEIAIYANGGAYIEKNLEIYVNGIKASEADPTLAGEVFLETNGQVVFNAANWFGTIFSPNGSIILNPNTDVIGAVYSGQNVVVNRGCTINYVPSRHWDVDVLPPVIEAALANDTGRTDRLECFSDNLTSDPTVTGAINDESALGSVWVSLSPDLINPIDIVGDLVLQADGSFLFDRAFYERLLGAPMTDGAYSLRIQAADIYGNVSDLFELAFILDTTAPILEVPDLQDTSDSGASQIDNVTNIEAPAIDVNTESEALVRLLVDGVEVFTNTVGPLYQFTLPPPGEGIFAISATGEDKAGNVGISADLDLTIDTTAPAVSKPDLQPTSDSGASNTDNLTNDTTPTVDVVSDPDTVVTLLVDGVKVNQSTGGPLHIFNLDPLADGTYEISATGEDKAGNVAVSDPLAIQIDTIAPVTALPDLQSTSDSGISQTDNITNVEARTVDIDTEPDALVRLLVNGIEVLTSSTGPLYQFTLPPPGEGVFAISATAEDRAGNIGTSPTLDITIDTTPPVVTLDLDPSSDSEPLGDKRTTHDQVMLAGNTEPICHVELYNSDDLTSPISSTTGDPGGNVNFSDLIFDFGPNSFTTVATDLAGNQASAEHTFHRDVVFLIEGTNFEVTYQEDITIPDIASHLSITYSELFFDTSDDFIKDAFELALVDSDGQSLVHRFTTDRDAYFNITEGQDATLGANTVVDGHTIKVDLSHITAGISALLIVRLVNNDHDTTTSVYITDVSIEPGALGTPLGVVAPLGVEPALDGVDLSTLSDVTASIYPDYRRTSYNEEKGILYAGLQLENIGTYTVGAPLVAVIDHISDAGIQVVDPDGWTLDGKPYYDFSGLIPEDGILDPTDQTGLQHLAFYNPNGIQFDYDLIVLGQLNRNPIFTSDPIIEAIAGKPYTYDADAVDPDGDLLTYSLITGPQDAVIDPDTGVVKWTPAAGQEDLGNHDVVIHVEDGRGGSALQEYQLHVIAPPPNRPPVFTSTPIVDATVGREYQYDADAIDPDFDPLSYNLLAGPDQMYIDSTSGLVSWTPVGGQLGEHQVQVEVNDGRGGTAIQSYVVAVLPDPTNNPPVITSDPVTVFAQGNDYTYDVDAIDPDGDSLIYELIQAPVGMTIDSSSGLIRWAAIDTLPGSHEMAVKVMDGRGGLDTQAYTLYPMQPTDLTITNVDRHGLTYDGQALTAEGTVTAQISNVGPIDVDQPFDVLFFEDHDHDGLFTETVDPVFGIVTITDPLPAGQSITISEEVSGSVLFIGNLVWGWVDSGQVISESDEFNNMAHSGENCTYIAGPDTNPIPATNLTASYVRHDTSDPVSPNNAPVAYDLTTSALYDTPTEITLTASDLDGNPLLTYEIVDPPTNGILSGTSPNLTYTPNSGYIGSDSFTFKANDGTEDSNITTIAITVYGSGEGPQSGIFSPIDTGMVGISHGALAWGDYDNDGDLDLLISGTSDGGYNLHTRIYKNDEGVFTDINAGLMGMEHVSLAWGDYDNDGDLDIVIAGQADHDDGRISVAKIYRNDEGLFVDINAMIPQLYYSSVGWGDYDNDGDLDLAIVGKDKQADNLKSKIYRNDNGSFQDSGISLVSLHVGSIDWGDYDNDGDLDLAVMGSGKLWPNHIPVSKICRNDNSSFTDINANLIPTGNSGADSGIAWGDYDNDGDLDLAITGAVGGEYRTIVYRNDGSGTFVDINAPLIGLHESSLDWGDYDNDGDLDLALMGRVGGEHLVAKIYRNDSGSFTDINASLTGVFVGSLAWGDYDNDGDLDLVMTGAATYDGNWVTNLYRNDGGIYNTLPTAPDNLAIDINVDSITFSWDPASDNETPIEGLSYNIRVGSTPGDDDVFTGMADTASGLRLLPATGNAQKRLSWTLQDLPPATYYWNVQAIDTAFAGGPWAQEQTFSTAPQDITYTARIGNGGAIVAPAGVSVSFYNGDPQYNGVYLGSVTTTTALEPGYYEDVEITVSVFGGADIWVWADDDGTGLGQVNECNEDDNLYHPGSIVGNPADLAIKYVDRQGLTYDGQTLAATGTVTAEITNLGSIGITEPFDVLFFEDRDHNGRYNQATDNVLGQTTVTESLLPGATTNVSVDVSGAVLFVGNIVWGFVDSEKSIAETDESNNLAHSGESCTYTPGQDTDPVPAANLTGSYVQVEIDTPIHPPTPATNPVAEDQELVTDIDTAINIILTGDDPEGDPLDYSIVDQPIHGILTGTGAQIIYTPEFGYEGPDGFTFRVSDGTNESPSATVAIRIGAEYTITHIGTLPGKLRSVAGANNLGQCVGTAWSATVPIGSPYTTPADKRAFFWVDGNITDLGTLGGEYSGASGINDQSQIVGWAHDDEGIMRAFLWQEGQMHDLGALPGMTHSHAFGINNYGYIIGITWANTDTPSGAHSFIWLPDKSGSIIGEMIDLGTVSVKGINEKGQILGRNNDGEFILTPEDTDTDGIPDRWFKDADGNGENDLIEIIIESSVDADVVSLNEKEEATVRINKEAFLYKDGQLIPFSDIAPWDAAPNSSVGGLNNLSQMVGRQYHGDTNSPNSDLPPFGQHGFLVDFAQGISANLNDLFTKSSTDDLPVLEAPGGITDRGLISGYGWYDQTAVDERAHTAFLMKPSRMPIAHSHEINTYEETITPITLVAYDPLPEAEEWIPLRYKIVTPPEHGALAGVGAELVYTPHPGYSGPDSFSFIADDGVYESNVATVDITVIPRVKAISTRVGNGGAVSTPAGVKVAFYDGEPNKGGIFLGQTLTETELSPGQYEDVTATLAVNHISDLWVWVDDDGVGQEQINECNEEDNIYQPGIAVAGEFDLAIVDLNRHGLTYDGQALTVVGTVTANLTNNGINDIRQPFEVLFFEDRDFDGLYTDGVDNYYGKASVAETIAAGQNIEISTDISGSTLFIGNLVWAWVDSGEAIIEFNENNNIAHSGENCTYNTGTEVLPASNLTGSYTQHTKYNETPVAKDQELTTPYNTELVINLSAWNPEEEALYFGVIQQPEHGLLSGTGSSLIYTPNTEYSGLDFFTFVADDGSSESNIATVLIEVLADKSHAPIAENQTYYVQSGETVDITLYGYDPDGDPITFTIVDGPQYAYRFESTPPNLTYQRRLGDVGIERFRVDSFTYKVSDGVLESDIATVEILIARKWNENVGGPVAWGDFDNDQDLDLIAGITTDPGALMHLYQNHDGQFFDINYLIAGGNDSYFCDWGDYDNDGDLDLAIAGSEDNWNNPIAKIYRNDEGHLYDIGAGLLGLNFAAVAWGDYDNDGDLDLATCGESREGIQEPRTILYRNDAGMFVDSGITLANVICGSLAWGDYNNDGHLDLALSGNLNPRHEAVSPVTKIYKNIGGMFVISKNLTGLHESAVAWVDHDNDGDLDLSVAGRTWNGEWPPRLVIYENQDGSFTDIQADLPGVWGGSLIAWGDYDNDGDFDLAISGHPSSSSSSLTAIYRNEGSTFVDTNAPLPNFSDNSIAWGDYDNDMDLDLYISKHGIHTNASAVANTLPTAPSGLNVSIVNNQTTFSWNPGSDAETPVTGLSYNLRVGTTPGGNDILSGMADTVSGYRYLPKMGNVQKNISWTLNDLPPDKYYWSVQAIDTAYAGSVWAQEHSFLTSRQDITTRVGNGGAIPTPEGAEVAFYDGDPQNGGTYLGSTHTTTEIAPGRFEDVEISLITQHINDLWVWVDDNGMGQGQVNECNEEDNIYDPDAIVVHPNRDPEFTSSPVTEILADDIYYYKAEVYDQDDDPVTFSLDTAPAGMTVATDTGLVEWSTTTDHVGAYEVVLRVEDGQGGFALQAFQLEVKARPTNRNPLIISTPLENVWVGELYYYQAVATDADGDTLIFDLPVRPAGMAVDSSRGVVVWTAKAEQTGSHDVVLRVQDGRGGVNLQSFQVTAHNPNTSPTITSTPHAPAWVDVLYQYQVTAQDAEGDTLAYSLDTAPAGMAIDPDTGLLTWTATLDQLGVQTIVIHVEDGQGGLAIQSMGLPVAEATANDAPSITSTPRGSIELGQTYLYQVLASDPNHDPLTYSLDTSPASMTVDASGLVTWTPTGEQFGANDVSIRVEDGRGGWALQEFIIAVVSQQTNGLPQIISTPPLVATAGVEYAYDLVGTDPDNDPLFWTLETAPEGMSLGERTGTLRWSPTGMQIGVHEVSIRVLDGQGAWASQSYALTVHAVNTPPGIVSIPETNAYVDYEYRYTVRAEDVDGDTLQYALQTGPVGIVMDAASGLVQWLPDISQVGTWSVEVEVTDGRGGVATQSYDLVVLDEDPNQPPIINTDPPLYANVGELYTYDVEATDPEGEVITYALTTHPDGMLIIPDSGLILWSPTEFQAGGQDVVITVTDTSGAQAEQAFTLAVISNNQAPEIASFPQKPAAVDLLWSYDVVATDPEGDDLFYSLVDAPAAMTIDDLGRVRWTPDQVDVGDHRVEILVADTWGASDAQAFILTVFVDDQPPQLILTLSQNPVEVHTDVTITAGVADNVGIQSAMVTLDGIPLALDSRGQITMTMDIVGQYEVGISATDLAGNTSADSLTLYVFDPNDVNPPVVEISSPSPGDTVTTFTDVIGTVEDDNLISWSLSVAPSGTSDFVEFASGTETVTDAKLGTFDPTVLANGSYTLRLTASDAGANNVFYEIPIDISSELKLGNFTLSFTDMSVPVSGIPITVTRTYDSLQANRNSEVGYGWHLEISDTNLTTSLPPTTNEEIGIYPTFEYGTRVYITLPGGDRVGFTFEPEPVSGFAAITQSFFPKFTPDPGVTSQLTVKQVLLHYVPEYNEFDFYSSGWGYNPADTIYGDGIYTLTTQEGLVYTIDGQTGKLRTLADPNNNTLTYTPSAITSSAGPEVLLVRDPQGRITEIIDPAGNSVTYAYDTQGDLVAVTDRDGNVTQFMYRSNPAHYLEEIIDPQGHTGVRTEYDEFGRLISMVDAAGNLVGIAHDPEHSMEIVTDALGNVTSYVYDERGNVVTEVDALGNTTQRTYDEYYNQVLTETDALGNTTTYTYNGLGNILTQTDPLGNITGYTYDSQSRLLKITDPLGNTTTNTYDSKGNLASTTDSLGNTTTYTYNGQGNQTGMTDALGNTTTYEYDSTGNLIRQTDALGNVTTYTYDGLGNQTSVTDALGNMTTYEYDASGRLIRQTDALGNTSTTEYNTVGKTSATIDALGRRTEYIYDVRGQLVETIYPDGSSTRTEYDAAGRTIAQIDVLGRRTEFVYDALGRQIQTTYPDGTCTRTEYDAVGRMVAFIDALGNRTEFEYDAASRQIRVTDALGNASTTTYDAAGRMITSTDALGNTTQYVYDALGRVFQTIMADGSIKTTTYDALGRVVAETDPAGNVTQFEYDALGRLTAVIDALGQRTEYTYDAVGNHITQTDANGNTTLFEYDALSRKIATVLPLGQRKSTTYNVMGATVSTTDFNSDTITYEYDVRNRLIAKRFQDSTSTTFTYSLTGQRETVTDSRGTTSYTYDVRGRLQSRTDPDGTTISYSYDANGNRLTVTISPSSSVTTTYTYDALNRMATVTDPDGGLTTYKYDAMGRLIQTSLPNGTADTRTYDSLHRLISIEHSNSGGIFAGFTYTYDAVGNRLAVDEANGRRVDYTYDALNRLLSETITDAINGNRTISYVYDPVGNRLSRDDSVKGLTTYTYDANDRLLAETTGSQVITYTYDNNGNTLTKDDGSVVVTYTWNYENRLVAVDTDGDGVVDVEYEYDADGIRVSKAESGQETRFLIDTNRRYAQVLAEYAPDGTVSIHYVYGTDLISQKRGSDTAYYHVDGLGSTRALTDSVASVSDTYIYDAYGQTISQTGSMINLYLFAGEQRDYSIGLDYLRARYMSPSLGRFYGMDPYNGLLGLPISLQDFQYSNNNPVMYVDPSGNFSVLGLVVSAVTVLTPVAASLWAAYEIYEKLETAMFIFGAPSLASLHLGDNIPYGQTLAVSRTPGGKKSMKIMTKKFSGDSYLIVDLNWNGKDFPFKINIDNPSQSTLPPLHHKLIGNNWQLAVSYDYRRAGLTLYTVSVGFRGDVSITGNITNLSTSVTSWAGVDFFVSIEPLPNIGIPPWTLPIPLGGLKFTPW